MRIRTSLAEYVYCHLEYLKEEYKEQKRVKDFINRGWGWITGCGMDAMSLHQCQFAFVSHGLWMNSSILITCTDDGNNRPVH